MADRRPHLLFVCVENSCRSQMAEGFARAAGGDWFAAFSAGSRPAGRVDPGAIAFMQEKGIDLGSRRCKGLEALPSGIEWDVIVTMGCGDACPRLPARRRIDWDLPDPRGMDDHHYRLVRDRIETLVSDLLRESATGTAVEGGKDRR